MLKQRIIALEKALGADVLSFYGQIYDALVDPFLQVVEQLAAANGGVQPQSLYVVLTTPGGSAHTVERFVHILRHHYTEVNFIVPSHAYSAGTIFCMSGDKIFMDYSSVLGPIDPQVVSKEGRMVSALGYLDQVDSLIEKSRNNTLTPAELVMLKELDLADLRSYDQAKKLTEELLEKWLVRYKFRNLKIQDQSRQRDATDDEKEAYAQDIAKKLSNNNTWKTHGRPINIEILNDIGLTITDYSNLDIKNDIRNYHWLVTDYVAANQMPVFIHTRKFL